MERNKSSLLAADSNGDGNINGGSPDVKGEGQNEQTPEVIVEKVELKKTIHLFGVIAILMANIGGSSIFIAPTTILRFSGSPGMSLILWFLGGLIQASLAFSVVEIALIFKKAGGPYYFVYRTFGHAAGFVFMWGFLICIVGPTWALGAYTASIYLLSLFFSGCDGPPDALVRIVGVWILITLIALNCTHVKIVTKIQGALTSCKVIALLIIIVVGFIYIPTETGKENLNSFMHGTTKEIGNISLALFAGYFGYGGWAVITILAEEVKNPEKNIPIGLGVSFVVMIGTIVCANLAFYTVLTVDEALKSDAVATLFAERVHPALPIIISILVVLCAIGALNVLIMGQARVVFAAGRNGHMPRIMTMLHKKYNTPWPATWIMGLVSSIILCTGSVFSFITSISLYSGLMTISMVVCLFVLRRTQPEVHRPLRIPTILPILSLIVSVAVMSLSIIANAREMVTILIIISLSVPAYIILFHCEAVKRRLGFMDRIGDILQILFHLQYETAK